MYNGEACTDEEMMTSDCQCKFNALLTFYQLLCQHIRHFATCNIFSEQCRKDLFNNAVAINRGCQTQNIWNTRKAVLTVH